MGLQYTTITMDYILYATATGEIALGTLAVEQPPTMLCRLSNSSAISTLFNNIFTEIIITMSLSKDDD
jgi:hypothetical protein